MNTYMHKPMPYGAKVRKLFDGKFYLSPADRQQLIIMIECSSITRVRDAIQFIDERGEWLD